jgi:UDP-3-O-[3-hydroxymyristoyl] N-acetylglucosamine deacetylase
MRLPTIEPCSQQRTLKSITRAVGVGVHSGQKVELTLRPAPPDTGIVFRRVDLPAPVDDPGRRAGGQRHAHGLDHQSRRRPRRAQGADHRAPDVGLRRALGIDNLYVDITAEEVPILDGSAASFVFLLQSAGIALQDAPKRFLRVRSRSRCAKARAMR